jgi:DNA adenine methylase
MQKTKPLAPFLKWAGGKTWLAPRLAEMYEPFRSTHTWVEPFCGALGATLGVMPERAILNDVNSHLIELYQHIVEGLENTSDANPSLPFDCGWQNSEETFLAVRRNFNNPNLPFDCAYSAKAFYYLNRTCFNGLCRFNRKGEFNVGYGKYKSPKLDHDFSLYQEAFALWDFYNNPYEELLNDVKTFYHRKYFVYCDPPYDGGFTGYSGSFTWDDQVNLASTLAALNCPVVASNKATDRIIDLYQGLGFDIEFIDGRRRISGNGDRTSVKEILAARNLIV